MNRNDIKKALESRHHISVVGVAQWFAYDHLPEGPIREASSLLFSVAMNMCAQVESSPELTVALRNLLDAKDSFVRCVVEEVEDN